MAPSLRALPLVAGLVLSTLANGAALAAPVLAAARAEVRFERAEVCEVALAFTLTGATVVNHRLEVREGTTVELLGVDGATVSGPAHDIGRTRALTVSANAAPYTLRYRVTQAPAWTHRCPLWLPTTPTDGRSRAVQVRVTIPDATTPGATMPALTWTGASGTATLGHLPAVVIVPFSADGTPPPFDIARVMDLTAIATLVVGTGWWLSRRTGGRR